MGNFLNPATNIINLLLLLLPPVTPSHPLITRSPGEQVSETTSLRFLHEREASRFLGSDCSLFVYFLYVRVIFMHSVAV